MKLWYQSMSRFKAKPNGDPEALERALIAVKDPAAEIELHGITKIETSLHVACMMGAGFSPVAINGTFTPRIVENVVRAGLRDRLAPVRRMQVDRLFDLDSGFTDPTIIDDLSRRFQVAARANTDASGAGIYSTVVPPSHDWGAFCGA